MSFTAHVTELRLQRAFALLAANYCKSRILDIASQTGFSDISHFNRLFRSRFGGTPSDVRVEAHNISIQEVKRTHKARVDGRTSEGSDADQF